MINESVIFTAIVIVSFGPAVALLFYHITKPMRQTEDLVYEPGDWKLNFVLAVGVLAACVWIVNTVDKGQLSPIHLAYLAFGIPVFVDLLSSALDIRRTAG